MKPGVYDISINEYHSGPGISRSMLSKLKLSPYHYYKDYVADEKPTKPKDSDAQIIGNAFHTLVLEPHLFVEEYVINSKPGKVPELPRLKDVGREAYDKAKKEIEEHKNKIAKAEHDFILDSFGKTILTEAQYEQVVNMVVALKNNDKIAKLIKGAAYEKSLFWNDPETGLLCKCRPDIFHNTMICDLKTTRNASPHDFQRAVYHYDYYIQAAMLVEGAREVLGLDIKDFYFIVIEKEYPHASVIYKLDEMALAQGICDFKNLLFRLKECQEQNNWPSYTDQVISLPHYVFNNEGTL
jgi:exodeoxyribonuclease VIII